MPKLSEDEFICCLKQLIQDFPEYAGILELLIEEIRRGRELEIRRALQMLYDDEW